MGSSLRAKSARPNPSCGTGPTVPHLEQGIVSPYDYGPGDFPRGDPQALFVDEIEPGAFLQALVDAAPAWRRAALCRDMGTAVFFPARGESSKPALAVCGPCPVRADCLAEAIAEELDHGIRGGLTARARIAARKAQAVNVTEQAA
jgi:WhiB family transcriptional regulator, redox-sensing transcriptional regulator